VKRWGKALGLSNNWQSVSKELVYFAFVLVFAMYVFTSLPVVMKL